MKDFVGKRAREIKPSGIRKFFDIASKEKDVISLGVGEPDFVTPWDVRDAGIQSVKRGYTQYTSNVGLPLLRKEISNYLKSQFNIGCFSAEDIIITVGASEAIDITLRAIIDDGDEILIPDPSYVSYSPCVSLAGGVPVSVLCDENGFKITPESLERAITSKTKALIFPYPNNPTGGIMTKEDIEKLIPVILKHDLLVITDEIYAELTYGTKHVSLATYSELNGRVVLISGFSKAFAMTGWRVGYVCAQGEILTAIRKIHQYTVICAPTFSQYAALSALTNGKNDNYQTVNDMKSQYDKRRKFMYKSFIEMGLTCFEPQGAFYIFPNVSATGMDGETFAEKLLKEEKIAVVPGNAFGESGKDYIRCSYAYALKDLIFAMGKIEKFVKRHIKK